MLRQTGLVNIIFTFLLIICIQLFTPVNGAVGLFNGVIDPDRPNECKLNEKYYQIGKTPVKGYCGEITCSTDCHCTNYSCGLIHVVPPCFTVEDRYKAYPGCCPRGACPDENVIE